MAEPFSPVMTPIFSIAMINRVAVSYLHMNVTVPGLQTIFLHILGYSRELPFDTLTLLAIQKGK